MTRSLWRLSMIGALVICAALGAQDVRSTEVTYQDLRDGFKNTSQDNRWHTNPLKLTLNVLIQYYEDLKKILNIVYILTPYEKTDKKSFFDFFANISFYPLQWTKPKCNQTGLLF